MATSMKLFLALTAFSSLYLSGNCGFCRTEAKNFKTFGLLTLYEDARGQLPPTSSRPKGCRPIFINMLIRHGARYPHAAFRNTLLGLEEFVQNLNTTGKALQCIQELNALQNWKNWMGIYDDYNQTALGDEEVRRIAREYKKGFPELFDKTSDHDRFKLFSTDTARNIRSLRVFIREIFLNETEPIPESFKLNVPPLSRDHLWVWGTCAKYRKDVFQNKEYLSEYYKFLQGRRVDVVRKDVANRLGVEHSRVTPKVLENMYRACVYERWVDFNFGPWCSIFKPSDLEVLGHLGDLYQIPRISKTAIDSSCSVTKEIIDSLNHASDRDLRGDKFLHARVRIVHGYNILPLAANLGLFKLKDLRLSSPYSENSDKIKLSSIAPSGANIAFVLYRCDSTNGSDPSTEQCMTKRNYRVQIFLNENLVADVPACSAGSSSCNLVDMLKYYRRFVSGSEGECDQQEICEVKD